VRALADEGATRVSRWLNTQTLTDEVAAWERDRNLSTKADWQFTPKMPTSNSSTSTLYFS
jgi:hypothetical protein